MKKYKNVDNNKDNFSFLSPKFTVDTYLGGYTNLSLYKTFLFHWFIQSVLILILDNGYLNLKSSARIIVLPFVATFTLTE